MFDWDQRPHILNYWFPQIIFVWAPRSVVFPDVVTAKTTPSWRHWRAPVLVTSFHLSRGRGDTRTRACPQNCACAIVLFSCIPKTVHVRFVESHRVSVHWCSLNRRHGVWSQQVLGEDNLCHCIGSLTLNIRLEIQWNLETRKKLFARSTGVTNQVMTTTARRRWQQRLTIFAVHRQWPVQFSKSNLIIIK